MPTLMTSILAIPHYTEQDEYMQCRATPPGTERKQRDYKCFAIRN